MEEGALNGTAGLGEGLPTGSRVGEGVGVAVPRPKVGDWANRRALELRGEEGGGDYLQVEAVPRGRLSGGGEGMGVGTGARGLRPGVQTH